MKQFSTLIMVFTILLFMGSCEDMLNSPDGTGLVSPEKGCLTVQVAGGARTALPAGLFDKYVLRFEYEGTEAYTHDDTEWSSTLAIDLEPGDWKIHADAYSDETLVGTGNTAVTVEAGSVTPVTIRITTIKTGSGIKGTLKYTVSYPADSGGYTYEIGEGDLGVLDIESWIDNSGTPILMPVTNGVEGTKELDAGVYLAAIQINETLQGTSVTRLSMVHIYGGQDTVLKINVGADEFTVIIPVTGTADIRVPDGLTVKSRVVRAYDGATSTPVPVGTSEELSTSGQANFVVRISPLGETFLRQELVVEKDGEESTLTGAWKTVQIPRRQTTVDRLTTSLDDTFYGVSINSGISNGTVAANAFAFLEGSEVTLTVEPDFAYVLTAETLLYLDNGATRVNISGPPYTFTMPASDITVTAEFKPVLGVTIEGPQDLTVAVTAVHSAGHTPPTEISRSAGESVSFTLDSSDYTTEAGTLKWFVEVEQTAGSGNSLTIHAKDYVERIFNVTVMIKVDGQWYSTEISFKVVE
ncbi:MAG: hypothetical protein LBD96_11175 [Treponema sp.]|nr:hypothetical protein [Treponema sp.]